MSYLFGNLCYHMGTICKIGGGKCLVGMSRGGGGNIRGGWGEMSGYLYKTIRQGYETVPVQNGLRTNYHSLPSQTLYGSRRSVRDLKSET